MNVLSLFDGISCGRIAIERAGLHIDKYYASEIDKYAIKVAKSNYADTIHIGDVRDIDASMFKDGIDMLIGGSPCQSFSFAGNRAGMKTRDNVNILTLEQYLQLKTEGFSFIGESYLFWEYVRLLRELKPKYFILENVAMEEEWAKVITKTLGVHYVDLNSRLVSAQNRRRFYWTNIGLKPQGLFGDMEQTIQEPKDRGVLLKDILLPDEEIGEKYFVSDKMQEWLYAHSQKMNAEVKIKNGNDKSSCLCGTALIKGNLSSDYIIHKEDAICVASRGRQTHGEEWTQEIEPRTDGKTNTLTSVYKDNMILVHNLQRRSQNRPSIEKNKNAGGSGHLIRTDGKTYCLDSSNLMAIENAEHSTRIRKLLPIECERLQTIPDNYTNHCSDAQRYKQLGNGWTIDIIVHILNHI
jgi:DNA-cytosine methyltransferase